MRFFTFFHLGDFWLQSWAMKKGQSLLRLNFVRIFLLSIIKRVKEMSKFVWEYPHPFISPSFSGKKCARGGVAQKFPENSRNEIC